MTQNTTPQKVNENVSTYELQPSHNNLFEVGHITTYDSTSSNCNPNKITIYGWGRDFEVQIGYKMNPLYDPNQVFSGLLELQVGIEHYDWMMSNMA
jgi:hypothetical protein